MLKCLYSFRLCYIDKSNDYYSMNNNYYCVILAGGIGTRLWPYSRQTKPKQFIDFLGVGETMLQATYRRYSEFIDKENIIIVSNSLYSDIILEQLPYIPKENLLMEPMRRNTVPSVTWAAIEIAKRNPNACMVVSPADQMITNDKSFSEDILFGLDYASRNSRLLTLGVAPLRPETNYGYIQMGNKIDSYIYSVQSFTEKPEIEFAKMFVESKEFLWNTGLFIWSVNVFLDSVHNAASSYITVMDEVQHLSADGENVISIVEEAFSKCPNIPLEEGVLEKADNVDVLLCHFGWADVGTWGALYTMLPKDDSGNVLMNSKTFLYDSENCIVKMPKGKVAILQGLNDYVVVDDGNVLVVYPKSDQGAIRKFVNDVQLTEGDDLI